MNKSKSLYFRDVVRYSITNNVLSILKTEHNLVRQRFRRWVCRNLLKLEVGICEKYMNYWHIYAGDEKRRDGVGKKSTTENELRAIWVILPDPLITVIGTFSEPITSTLNQTKPTIVQHMSPVQLCVLCHLLLIMNSMWQNYILMRKATPFSVSRVNS